MKGDALAALRRRTHQQLVRAVLRAGNLVPGVFLFPVDVARRRGFKRTLGMPGTPDILGWRERPGLGNLPKPIFVAFECKIGRDRLTAGQRAFLERLRAAGGIAGEIRAVGDAVGLLTRG